MSTRYKIADEVPSTIICKRLEELSDAVTEGDAGLRREFYMRIPAECDRDADLVLSAAAKRIRDLEKIKRVGVCRICGKTGSNYACKACYQETPATNL